MAPSWMHRTSILLVVLMLVGAPFSCGPSNVVHAEDAEAIVEAGAQGGSWIDTFDDGSGIDWGSSNNVTVNGGNASINRTYDVRTLPNGTWHLDKGSGTTAYDSTDGDNDGTLENGIRWTTGRYGQAVKLDGTDDYVNFSHSSRFDMEGDLSIALWVNKTSDVSYAGLVGRWDWNAYNLMLTSDGKKMRVELMKDASNYDSFDDTTEISNGTWTHLAFTFNDTSDKLSFYVNGSLSKEHTASGSYDLKSTSGLVFGSNSPTLNRYFEGAMDEVEIFAAPLSAKEVENMYLKGPYRERLSGNITSLPISLPTDMRWDTLVIGETHGSGQHLNVTLLNATDGTAIPGTSKYTQAGEFDISGIDPARYPSIRLNASFQDDGFFSPDLHYWGVSWNRTGVWRDTFFAGARVASTKNVRVSDGEVLLPGGGLPSNAVAIWLLDEGSGTSAKDATANGHDASLKGGASWTTGKRGKALQLDGTDDYALVSDSDDFDFGTGQFTLSAWVKTTATTGTGAGRDDILAKGDPTISGYSLSARSNKATFFVVDQGALFGTSDINDGSWHHIVGTKDSSGTIVLYVDGTSEATSTNNENVDTTYDVYIGKHGTKSESYFDGSIDEVAIFKEALTSTEVKDLYKKGFDSVVSSGNLVSKTIEAQPFMMWDRLRVNRTVPTDTTLNVTVIDAVTNRSLPSFENLDTPSVDLSSINHRTHSKLKLRANLGSSGSNTSVLHDWSVTFVRFNDSDNDGVEDKKDAFPRNPFEYRDTDGDGVGDTADPDADGDGVMDERDAFPRNSKEWVDTDGDGVGDNADDDDDGDGAADADDAFPRDPREFLDSDGDGIGDWMDPDDDGNGVLDDEEWMEEVSREIAGLMVMVDGLQASLKDDLVGIEVSLQARLDALGADALSRIDGMDSSLAEGIRDVVTAASADMEAMGLHITSDVDDLEAWVDEAVSTLEGKLAGANATLLSRWDELEKRSLAFHQGLGEELEAAMRQVAMFEANLTASERVIRERLVALSTMTSDLSEQGLAETSALLASLAESISGTDGATAARLADLAATIDDFRAGTDADLEDIERTLEDLARLDAILADLEALDRSLGEAEEALGASVEDAGDEQQAASELNMTLLVVALVLSAVLLVLLLTRRRRRFGRTTMWA